MTFPISTRVIRLADDRAHFSDGAGNIPGRDGHPIDDVRKTCNAQAFAFGRKPKRRHRRSDAQIWRWLSGCFPGKCRENRRFGKQWTNAATAIRLYDGLRVSSLT
jgi:hypothetical protein